MRTSSIFTAAAFCLLLTACQAGEQAGAPAPRIHSVSVASPFGESSVPTVAIDQGNGTAHAVFFRGTEGVFNLYASHRDRGQPAWSAPVRVNSVDGDVSPHLQAPAQVVVSPDGDVHVVWTNAIPVEGRRFPASNLLIASSRDGGRTFEPQHAINSDAGGLPSGHTFHDVTVAADGRIVVTWLDSRNKERRLHDGHEPSTDPTETGSEIWLAISDDGGRTFRESTVAVNTCQCCRTSVITGQDGQIHLAWRHVFEDGSRDMVLSTSTDGGIMFDEPRRIHYDNWQVEGCPHSGPSLALDDDDNIHVAWYTGAPEREGLYYAMAEPGKAFSDPVPLVQGVAVSQVKLARASANTIWLAWEEQPSALVRLGQASAARGLERITDHALDGFSPAIAAGSDGLLLASQLGTEVHILQAELVTDNGTGE